MVLRGYPSSSPEHNYLDNINLLTELNKTGLCGSDRVHDRGEMRPLINILSVENQSITLSTDGDKSPER